MTSVLDQAQNVSGLVSAARMRERWQQQEAKATDPERREQLREAIADLEFRFPELEEIPPGGAEAFARDRGHGTKSRSPVHEGRRRPGSPAKPKPKAKPSRDAGAKPSGKGGAGKSTPAPAQQRPRRAAGGGGRRRRSPSLPSSGRYNPSRLYSETGIPGAAWSATSLTMSVLGMTVGLSLLYLLLTSSERKGSGAQAFPQLLGAVTGFVQRFVSTRDILGEGPGSGPVVLDAIPGYSSATTAAIGGPAGGVDTGALLEQLPELPPMPKRGQRVTPTFPKIKSKPRRRRR
jgi:hypothetical protein